MIHSGGRRRMVVGFVAALVWLGAQGEARADLGLFGQGDGSTIEVAGGRQSRATLEARAVELDHKAAKAEAKAKELRAKGEAGKAAKEDKRAAEARVEAAELRAKAATLPESETQETKSPSFVKIGEHDIDD